MDQLPTLTRRLSAWMRIGAARAVQHHIEQNTNGLVEFSDGQVVALCAFGMAAWAATGRLPAGYWTTGQEITRIAPYLTYPPGQDRDDLGILVRQIGRRNDQEHQTPTAIAAWLESEGW